MNADSVASCLTDGCVPFGLFWFDNTAGLHVENTLFRPIPGRCPMIAVR